jgi:pimeloyl-ACP methyl ester carboxylesterase
MIVAAAVALVTLLLLYALLRPLLSAWLFSHPSRVRPADRTPTDWGAAYEDVTISSDGGQLRGWYVPSRNGAAVVLLHDHGANRLALAPHAATLTRAGYGVLLLDLRAHGRSEGWRFDPGAAVDDALAAVAWVARRHDVQARVAVLGVGLGGTLALHAAARNAFIRGAVADGPLPGALRDLPPPAGAADRLWRYPQAYLFHAALERLAPGPGLPGNVHTLSRLDGRPVLLLAAGRGRERRLTRHLFAAAAEPKTLYEIPDATHATGWAVAPEPYARHLLAFLGRALSVDGPPDAATQSAAVSPGDGAIVAPRRAGHAPHPVGERTVAPAAAMMLSFATVPVALLGLFVPYQLRWGLTPPRLPAGRPVAALLGFFALLLAGLLLHEAAHLAAYYVIGRVPRGAARLGGGHIGLAPRVRCATLLPARTYRAILLAPSVLLGLLPGIIGIVVGSWLPVVWGVWMLVASGGNLVILWAMRGLPAATPVRAHPTRAGCEFFAAHECVQNVDI